MPSIAYDPHIFYSQEHGGISRYFCEIASRIEKYPGVQTTIVAPLHINSHLMAMPNSLVSGFKAPDTKLNRLPLRKLAVFLGDIILRAKQPDIVHETYYYPRRIGSRSARRVLTIYDMIYEKFASSFPANDRTSRYKALAAKRADHIICISESTRRDAMEILGLSIDQTSVIYLGYDLMEGHNKNFETPPPKSDKPFLLYVGNRDGYKNFSALLRAISISRQLRTHFNLICFGGGAFSRKEINTIISFNLDTGQVIQHSGNDRVLANLYRNAFAFVYPSLYEGFGIPPLEAMSFDCPVVCSNTSSIPEVVGNAGEYFDPYDPESICQALELVVNSEFRRNDLKAKGQLRLTKFSWDQCASETLEVYKKLL